MPEEYNHDEVIYEFDCVRDKITDYMHYLINEAHTGNSAEDKLIRKKADELWNKLDEAWKVAETLNEKLSNDPDAYGL